MTATSASDYWRLIHAERIRIATMLERLNDQDWRNASLCSDWNIEATVAHLTAGANTTLLPWLGSMVRFGFNASKHNERRLAKYLGDSPAETLTMYRSSASNTSAPTKDYAAWLGEVIVHGQDIARPLDLKLTPEPVAVHEVARFYAEKDFAVNSKSLIKDLTLEANDSDFRIGSGPIVRGNLLDLIMTMAGRPNYLSDLEGDGVAEIKRRIT